MKSEPLRVETADVVALVVAGASVALFLSGHRAQAALAGASALTLLAVSSWARAKRAQKELARLKSERDELRSRIDRLERLAATGLASAGLAHELKNDLMVTHGFAQLAKKAADERTSPEVRAHLQVVETQAQKLIDRLKSFVRLAAPQHEQASRPLGDVLDELVRLVAPLARQRDIAFESELGDFVALTQPVTDPDLRAALLDLLLNAIDHAKTKVRFGLESNDKLILSVEDDGLGIPAELANTLFEPFTTGRPGGLGIGLHRAKEAVEREGGALEWVKADTGARFVVTLPASVVKSDP